MTFFLITPFKKSVGVLLVPMKVVGVDMHRYLAVETLTHL
jgi:hypothetical protein